MDTREVHSRLRGIWLEVLDLPDVAENENFFDLGGTSLLIPRVQQRIRTTLGISVKYADFFRHPTLRTLTDYLIGRRDEQN